MNIKVTQDIMLCYRKMNPPHLFVSIILKRCKRSNWPNYNNKHTVCGVLMRDLENSWLDVRARGLEDGRDVVSWVEVCVEDFRTGGWFNMNCFTEAGSALLWRSDMHSDKFLRMDTELLNVVDFFLQKKTAINMIREITSQ